MTQQEFDALCHKILWLVKSSSPIKTGNLRFNAIKIEFVSDDECHIYVDGEIDENGNKSGIAPYMVFTNEPWLSPRWKGAKNPNERWWDNLAEEIADFIAMETNAQAKKTK
jgi:hypothetical protein